LTALSLGVLAAYAGLAPTPCQSGSIDHEQGVSRADNPRLRKTMVELAWLWLQNQPASALSLWFRLRFRHDRSCEHHFESIAPHRAGGDEAGGRVAYLR
jgi:hypothetical protein